MREQLILTALLNLLTVVKQSSSFLASQLSYSYIENCVTCFYSGTTLVNIVVFKVYFSQYIRRLFHFKFGVYVIVCVHCICWSTHWTDSTDSNSTDEYAVFVTSIVKSAIVIVYYHTSMVYYRWSRGHALDSSQDSLFTSCCYKPITRRLTSREL